ncbi:hypothetical protein HKD22_07260 [Gluconobacter kanchanaburiensis]|nr:hypothetical protein [Gluconobacter kanchanaburiensis]
MSINRRGIALAALLFGTGLAAAPTVHAADTLGTPVGHVTLSARSADVGIGYTWGDGTLTYGHQTYHFKVTGANIAAVGYSALKAEGTVYNLKHLHDFDGSYGALAGEATLDKGLGGAVLTNSNGVRIKIETATQGARLAAGAQGLTFTLSR